MSRNIKIVLEYDGTDFHGSQVQPTSRTVQGEMIRVLERITNESVRLIFSARTDAGVHAMGQTVNFHTNSMIPEDKMMKGLNSLLPKDIAITSVKDVPEAFNARFSALSRVYIFTVDTSAVRSAFRYRRSWFVPEKLNIEDMLKAVKYLIGEMDFSSFRSAGDTSRHSIRRMIKTGGWTEDRMLYFYFEANAFLQHMIRNIMGTLMLVGKQKMSPDGFKELIQLKDRTKAGPTAPPHGLCLMKVTYPKNFE